MKWSFASVGVIVAGIVGIVIIMLFEQITTNNESDYYLLKEITEAAMIDAIDTTHYRETGELKIVREKFVENFTRRFAESTVLTGTGYTISFFDIMETPPKVSVTINTGIGEYTIFRDTSDYNVANKLDAILEYKGKTDGSGIASPSNPYKHKTLAPKTYYSLPSKKTNATQIGATRALNIPEELKAQNIKNIQIDNIKYLGNIDNQEDLMFAILNREIDYAIDSNTESTDYSLSIDKFKYKVSNPSFSKYNCGIDGLGTNTIDCDKSKYWISWTGTIDKSATGSAIKFEITWSYDEYEYAD